MAKGKEERTQNDNKINKVRSNMPKFYIKK